MAKKFLMLQLLIELKNPLFIKLKSEKILSDNLNHSNEWLVDESIIEIKG